MTRPLAYVAAALLLLPSLSAGQVRFEPGRLLASDEAAVTVVAGDYDGDGRDDLAVFDVQRRLTFHLQKTRGAFIASPVPEVPFEPTPHIEPPQFAAADFNEDGRDDLVFASDGGWRMLLSQPGGGWVAKFPPANARQGVAAPVAVDLNRDGHLDLVQAEQLEPFPGSGQLIGSALHLYFGDGLGGLVAVGAIETGAELFRGVVAGHFNADPFVDIATAEADTPLGDHLVLRYGHGGTGFSAPVRLPQHAYGIASGDFDGDGFADLVAGGFRHADGSRLRLYRQLPGGLLDSPRALPMAGTLRSAHRTDIDGDGDDDLVALADDVNIGTADTWLLSWRQHDGALQMPEQANASGYQPARIDGGTLATGDFDGDGRGDVAEITIDGIRLHLARPKLPSGGGMPPLAPTITGVQTQEGDDYAALTIARPAGDGGLPILGYRVVTTPAGPFVRPFQAPEGSGPFTVGIPEIPFGVAYQVQVQAFNAAGDGALSAPVPLKVEPFRQLDIAQHVFLPEGDAGPVVHQVPISLNWPAGAGGVRFDVYSPPPGENDALPGVDYEPVALQGVFIPEGQTGTTIPVTIIGNTTEGAFQRSFQLIVHNVSGARTVSLMSWVHIRGEELPPTLPSLYGAGARVVEGDSGRQLVRVRAVFDKPVTAPVVVGVDTDDRFTEVGTRALPPEDYDATPIPDFTVQAGEKEASIYIPVNGDMTEEFDENFPILFYVVSGPAQVAYNGRNIAFVTIVDDDRPPPPPLRPRADRIVVPQGGLGEFSFLANDVYDPSRTVTDLDGVSPDIGELHYVLDTADDNRLLGYVFRPAAGFFGSARMSYWLCDLPPLGSRCEESGVEFVVRPVPEAAVTLDVDAAAGHRDIVLDGLQPMPGARFDTTRLVQPLHRDVLLAGDPDPISPWDAAVGRDVSVHPLARPGDGQSRTWRVLVDAATAGDGDVDLYLGIDADGDGVADPDEVQCTSAMQPSQESCELEIVQPGDQAVSYWVMLHNRGTAPLPAQADIVAVRVDATGDRSLVATDPGRLQGGEQFALRLAWNDPAFLPGERRVGYLRVRKAADDEGGLVPVRLRRDDTPGPGATIALANAEARSFAVPAQAAHRRVFIDVPEGATALAVQTRSAQPVDLYLVPAGPGSSPQIDDAPASAAAASSTRAGGDEDALVDAPAPGRWYAIVENTGTLPASVEITATVTATPPLVRSGSYFNPDRAGHGLVLYPAADQWVGLWYTYFQDGTPTWLYLQARAPGANGIWTTPIYRTAWSGAAQHLVRVGTATVTPTGADAFRFTWTFDGETGSEPMQSLGRGCPRLAGAPLDASSHWFDAVRAGTGYSVQLWPDYEMYLSFVYDAQGTPRFLIAEGPGFGGTDRVLPLEQLRGFCPNCARTAAPERRTVGTFQRSFGGGAMQVGIDGLYTPQIPGAWSAEDDARPLGGPGTTQGCAP